MGCHFLIANCLFFHFPETEIIFVELHICIVNLPKTTRELQSVFVVGGGGIQLNQQMMVSLSHNQTEINFQ